MVALRRVVPVRLRPIARLLRRAALKALGAPPPTTTATTASDDPAVLDTEAVLRLLYGANLSDHTRSEAHGALNGYPVRDITDVRHVLGTLDRGLSPSPVAVRFRSDDLRWVTIGDLTFALDVADASVSRPIIEDNIWEPHLTAIFRRFIKPGDHVIDIGANIGYFTALASQLVGGHGRVTAVEPNSENCRLILATADRNGLHNIDLLPVALDATRGWAHFSTHIGSNGSMRRAEIDGIIADAGLIVPTFPLDSLVERAVNFVKIDVEGAEYRALQGAQRILDHDRPIVSSEFSVEMIERISGVPAREYLALFTDRGYQINVIERTDGSLRPYANADALLATWPTPIHLEDLLFLPPKGIS
jgi:FkbM family methyltransferase